MLTKVVTTFTSVANMDSLVLPPLSFIIICILQILGSLSICGPLFHKSDKDSLMVLEAYQYVFWL